MGIRTYSSRGGHGCSEEESGDDGGSLHVCDLVLGCWM